MELWLSVIIAALISVIIVLCIKIHLLQKSADEISKAFAERLNTDTNTLISISCRDRHMCALAADINNELRRLRDDRRKYIQGDAELKDAVTNISHDLRTPLTAISGYLQLLENEEKSDDAARYIEIIKNRCELMKQLTEELFRYSVVTSTSDKLKYESLSLNSVLEESISTYYAALKNAQINPDIAICESKVMRTLDKNALSRIFSNIISNAIKYSDGDLSISLHDNGEIIFSNHTSNMDEIQAGKLFNRFYTVENAEKSTGLGLSIAKVLTEKLNGSISAQYKNDKLSISVCFFEAKK
ncbi:MAG: HAMP domain-containing histidine kinase [Eubacterium sp.]|nr:HAMP domain-containing histidine kinase [Eubacterium sp.]